MSNQPQNDFARSAPYWLRRAGVVSWLFIGIVLAVSLILGAVAALNNLVTPLLVAIIFGIVFQPLVDLLERRRIPRALAALLTLLLILLGLLALLALLFQGLVAQGSEIALQLSAGWAALRAWLAPLALDPVALESLRATVIDALPSLGQGIVGFLGGAAIRLLASLIGLYFALFILFFLLRDGPTLQTWLARQLHLPPEIGNAIVADITRSVQLYFRGIALTAAITSLVVALPWLLLDLPLLGSLLILYFFTSFVPYLGAWLAGAFAVVVAFGSGGPSAALVILLAVIVSNGALQAMVSSWALGVSLKLHPLIVFLVTIAAGLVGGILLMILAVPLVAVTLQTLARLREAGIFAEE